MIYGWLQTQVYWFPGYLNNYSHDLIWNGLGDSGRPVFFSNSTPSDADFFVNKVH